MSDIRFEVVPHSCGKPDTYAVRMVNFRRKNMFGKKLPDRFKYLEIPSKDYFYRQLKNGLYFQMFVRKYFDATQCGWLSAKEFVDALTAAVIPEKFDDAQLPVAYSSKVNYKDYVFDLKRANELYHQLRLADDQGEPITDILAEIEKLHKNFDGGTK